MPRELIDDKLWSLIEPLLPVRAPRSRRYAGRKPTPDRAMLTGIVFVLRSGIAWNLLPKIVQGDRGYSSEPHRQRLRRRGITPVLAQIGSSHGSGLGKTRWVVERTIAWLHSFRRLKIRYERHAHVHEAFLSLACSLICWSRLKHYMN